MFIPVLFFLKLYKVWFKILLTFFLITQHPGPRCFLSHSLENLISSVSPTLKNIFYQRLKGSHSLQMCSRVFFKKRKKKRNEAKIISAREINCIRQANWKVGQSDLLLDLFLFLWEHFLKLADSQWNINYSYIYNFIRIKQAYKASRETSKKLSILQCVKILFVIGEVWY